MTLWCHSSTQYSCICGVNSPAVPFVLHKYGVGSYVQYSALDNDNKWRCLLCQRYMIQEWGRSEGWEGSAKWVGSKWQEGSWRHLAETTRVAGYTQCQPGPHHFLRLLHFGWTVTISETAAILFLELKELTFPVSCLPILISDSEIPDCKRARCKCPQHRTMLCGLLVNAPAWCLFPSSTKGPPLCHRGLNSPQSLHSAAVSLSVYGVNNF